MSVNELVQRAKNNWCAFSHGHQLDDECREAIDELARRARANLDEEHDIAVFARGELHAWDAAYQMFGVTGWASLVALANKIKEQI